MAIKELTIQEAMKLDGSPLRITNSGAHKWLVWNENIAVWIVYQQTYKQKFARILYEGVSQAEAVRVLLKD